MPGARQAADGEDGLLLLPSVVAELLERAHNSTWFVTASYSAFTAVCALRAPCVMRAARTRLHTALEVDLLCF
jgi:hypothetical protein